MDDVYLCGTCTRMSPEAPIPVVALPDDESGVLELPGGAAHVVAQLRTMGSDVVRVFGDGCPRKHRLMVGDTQVARWDENDYVTPISKVRFDQIAAPPGVDVIVVADYGKGAITSQVIEWLQDHRGQLFVDTKRDPQEWFGVADIFFPNNTEYLEYESTYRKFRGRVIHKQGAGGLDMYHRRFPACQHSPAKARHVRSVNGAGDVVIAACAYWAATNTGQPGYEMLRFANAAAAVVCEKPYTAVAELSEIQEVLKRR